LFSDLETGKINEDIFREKLTDLIGKNFAKSRVNELWNSILIDYFHDKIGLLQKLKSKYKLLLLSNTNEIHYSFYTGQFLTRYGYDFNDLFDKTYWSFKIGMRKPDREIFEKVIAENGLTRENALFIDDTVQNTESAEKYGLSSFWLSPGLDLSDLFDDKLNLNL
jgi:putative hydrolase of the HAD superfamily